MRNYNELTVDEQIKAQDIALNNLLKAIVEDNLRFNDKLNGDNLQVRVDKAIMNAEAMRTPWFVYEYIRDTCEDDLRAMSICDAEDAIYLDEDEYAIRL